MTAERKLLILGLLRMTDMHGYVLNAHIGAISPVTLKKPTAYNLLVRMEEDGWIKHHDEATGERQRKVFSLTAEGNEAFFILLRGQLGTYSPNESPALVSLSFLDSLPAEVALDLVQRRRELIVEYRRSFEHGDEANSEDPHAGSMQWPLEYARRLADLDLAFINEIIADLEKKLVHTKGDINEQP